MRKDELTDMLADAEFKGFLKGLAAARKDQDGLWFTGYREGFKNGTEIGERMAHQAYADQVQFIVNDVEAGE